MAARPGLPEKQVGYLLRAHHDVPAGHRLTHPPGSRRSLGRGAAPGRDLWRYRLHQRRGAALYPPVPAGLVRLPQPARSAR